MTLEEMYGRELNRWVAAVEENRKLRAELAEAKETIERYRRNYDTGDALCINLDPARVEIAAELLRDMAKARSRESNLPHPLTADRFCQVQDSD